MDGLYVTYTICCTMLGYGRVYGRFHVIEAKCRTEANSQRNTLNNV